MLKKYLTWFGLSCLVALMKLKIIKLACLFFLLFYLKANAVEDKNLTLVISLLNFSFGFF